MSRKQVFVVFWGTRDFDMIPPQFSIWELLIYFAKLEFVGGTLSEHGTSVPIGSTVISGLKSRAPTTTNINLSRLVLKLWDTREFFTQNVKKCLTMVRGVLNSPCNRLIEAVMH